MTAVSKLLSFIKWVFLALLAYILFVEVVLRIVRRYYHFPIPDCAAHLIDNPIRRRIQPPEKIVEWMGVKPDMRLLEVGPGPGTFTFAAARAVGETGRVYAIDIQESIVSGLNKKIGHLAVSNITSELASAYELPFPDGYFELVYMVTVLGEIPDKQRALGEFRRVLKDDGYLAIGEFLPDPDYPRKSTVVRWCGEAGFELADDFGSIMHYLLLFRKV